MGTDTNRVTVKIHGQEYTIAGASDSDQMLVVANHVDTLMNGLASSGPSMPQSTLAVLSAVNIANDLFTAKDRIADQENTIATLRQDAEHYIQMWEDAKSSFKQYKEDAQNSAEQLQELQRIFNIKTAELNKANDRAQELEDTISELKEKIKELEAAVEEEKENTIAQSLDNDEALKKYKELENSFFDIQMENMHLKNELDALKKR